jgi:L-lactate dehydrogenase complex protein LldE
MSETVQLFITCIMDTLYPETGEAVVQVLKRAGAQVRFPYEQTCCGQPAFNAGMRKQARQMAQFTIQIFEATSGWIVIPSGSCAAMIRHGYPELFRNDPTWYSRAKNIAERSVEFTEFLVDKLGVIDLGARFPAKIAYHSSCHLSRDLGVTEQPRLLLEAVEGAKLVELPESQDCCGFGGLFSIEHPALSTAMLDRKLGNFEKSGAELLVACDSGCLTHINGGLHRRGLQPCGLHIADILNQSGSITE